MGRLVLIFYISAAMAGMESSAFGVWTTANKTHQPIKCYAARHNTTSPLANYDAIDGGVPLNFGLNCLGWLIIFVLFCVIRRLVWDYGRLALTQKEDLGWTSVFYGFSQDKAEDKPTVKFPEVKDKGLLSWLPVLFRVTDEHIHIKCGVDALQYIQFQKHLLVYSVIIFCLSIGIVLPINYSGTNEFHRNSFGATTVSNLSPESSMFWLHSVFALLYLVIIVIVLRHFTSLFNFESQHESPNTIMITNIPKNVTRDLIQQHFVEVYDDSMVEEVQLAYDCDKLQQIQRKLEAARLGREHCEEIHQLTGERPQTTVSTSKISPCFQCCGAMHVDGIEYFTEEEEDAKVEFEQAKKSLKSLGVAFVTFVNEHTAQKCLKDFNMIKHGSPESSVSRKIFSDHWNVAPAPNPGDILWDHLSVDPESWWARALIINIILFIFVLFITTPTVLITSFNEIKASIEKKNPSLHIDPSPFFTQFLPTIMLWTFSAILPTVVSYSSYFEAHWTRSRLEHSVMIKTYVFLLLMIIILPSLALTSADTLFQVTFSGSERLQSRLACVFLPNNGAFFVNYLVTSALIGTALELCRFPELATYFVKMCFARNEGEKRLVRREAVREFAFGHQYAWMIVIFSVMVVYCITCPLVTPFGLLYLVFKHMVDRYNLYFNYRSPAYKYVDPTVHSTAVTFTVVSTFFLLLSILFFGIVRLGIDDPQTIFTLVLVVLTITAFVARMCFGVFKRLGPFKQRMATDEEEHITEVFMPEAYLPPILRRKRDSGANSAGDTSPPQLTRRKMYGTTDPVIANDHVVDTTQLTPSSETVVSMDDDERH